MVNINNDGSIADPYQNFMAISRYSKWQDDKGRRETWVETVDRYITNIGRMVNEKNNYKFTDQEKQELNNSIVNMQVLPSMRALMTAGPALDSANVSSYNCSFVPLDSVESFAELLYILTCGTGAGISVEKEYIEKLPVVPTLLDSNEVIVVPDSREGWADSLKTLMYNLYDGKILSWDVSQVRPAGARLKTFGGRASGPGVLVELFEFVIDIFTKAQGRKLSSEDCNDIACKIGVIVIAGSVRRSAILTLSDIDDQEMSTTKFGAFWEDSPQRSMANVSAVYNGRPDRAVFDQEWANLVASNSGERGIFNRKAAQEKANHWGRRSADVRYGLNPCAEIILNPYQFCNLSTIPIQGDETLGELLEKVEKATIFGTLQSTIVDFTYLRDIWKNNTARERLLGVSMTGIYGHPILNGSEGHDKLTTWLNTMRDHARAVNKIWAKKLGIPESAAITCIKPEGNSSQLTKTSSGLHPWHSEYYIRTVRSDKKDPVGRFLKDSGVPCENDLMKPEISDVFSFPVKAPEGAITRDQVTALDHLELWLVYQREWCEHNPSVTINVAQDEWDEVKEFVWEHFDNCVGVSFLPKDEHVYQQAPYQPITKEQYDEAVKAMPELDWTMLEFYEQNDDAVTSTKELACVANQCEIDYDSLKAIEVSV